MILSQAIKIFLVAMTAEGRCYYRDGMSAFRAHAGDIELDRLSSKTMRSFLKGQFARRRANGISTEDLIRRFYAVRLFISWSIRQGIIHDFDALKLQRKRPETYKETSKTIFRHARWCRKTFYYFLVRGFAGVSGTGRSSTRMAPAVTSTRMPGSGLGVTAGAFSFAWSSLSIFLILPAVVLSWVRTSQSSSRSISWNRLSYMRFSLVSRLLGV
ncbi:MAG: hypothetical protein ABSE06_01220 [Anaerolineaceae bacterium]